VRLSDPVIYSTGIQEVIGVNLQFYYTELINRFYDRIYSY